MNNSYPDGLEIKAPFNPQFSEILTPQALSYVARLQREFNPQRLALLEKRKDRQDRIDAGERPNFLPATAPIRFDPSWKVASTPDDL